MTAQTASLGMYDLPALHAANDALWRTVATHLRTGGIGDVPDALDRLRSLDAILADPHLLLAQTCGYPFARSALRYVATPRYTAPHCDGARHRSLFVVRADDPAETLADLRGRVAAVNAADSNTGYNLLRAALAPLATDGRFLGHTVTTGAHRDSAAAVAAGGADLAAIDAVTWAHLAAHEPGVIAGLRILDRSPPVPALPLVTAAGADDVTVAALRAALAAAAPVAPLLIAGFEILGDDAYAVTLAIEAAAARAGYPALA